MRLMFKPVVESLPEAIVHLTEEALIRVLHVDDDADFLNTAKPILASRVFRLPKRIKGEIWMLRDGGFERQHDFLRCAGWLIQK